MKKILVSTLTLIMMFCLSTFVQATVSTTTYTADADFTDMDPTFAHDSPRVDTVISCNMTVKPKTKAHLSRLCSSAIAKVKYYFNSSSSDIRTGEDYTDIVTDEFFYPSSGRISDSYIGGTINYKVSGDFQTKKSSGEIISLEVPVDSYQQAVIISSITKQVDLGVATHISVPTGDQSQPNWVGVSDVVPGCGGILVDWTFRFGGVVDDISRVSPISRKRTKQIQVLTGVNAATFVNIPGHGTGIYYTNTPQLSPLSDDSEVMKICRSAKKLIMEYNENQNACDETGKVLTEEGWYEIDASQTELLKVTDAGLQYPVFINAWGRIIAVQEYSVDIDCRPAKRTRVKSRIGTPGYPGFEFKGLQEGDSVKIYSVNGKKIAEITAGDDEGFVWAGRKGTNNSGDWAKSGIYVYQIKVDGKTISGTIVFVY